MKSFVILCGIFALFGIAYGQQCEDGDFECANGNCIPERWFCDGKNDCGDRSDEPQDCRPACPIGYVRCANGKCILVNFFCDGDNDCGDWSDEPEDCPRCAPGYWQCSNGGCIYEDSICDGENNCSDWSDEAEEKCPCAEDELRCPKPPGFGPPGVCIPPEYICDPEEIWDCVDGSDEANCSIMHHIINRTASSN